MTLGQLCLKARESRGLSQADAGAMTGFARRTVSDFERDARTESQFEYACKLACALDDMDLLRRAIEIETGVPVAGRPMPERIDKHAAALRDLAIREKHEAIEALRSIPFWRLGPEHQEIVRQAAQELLDSMQASQWLFDALCAAAKLDPDELMRRHRLAA